MLRTLLLLTVGLSLALPALAVPSEEGAPTVGSARKFWVWDLRVFPHSYREATARLVASGERADIYAEVGLPLPVGYSSRLRVQLEKKSFSGALYPSLGILASLEKLFGPLPRPVRGKDRLLILFTDVGRYPLVDGFANPADQLSAADAFATGERSNEANVVYVNGYQHTDEGTATAVVRGLEALLTFARRGAGTPRLDTWLSQTLTEVSLLAVGLFSEQDHINRYAQDTSKYPLVSHSLLQYGPQLLFASYLLDQANDKPGAIRALAELPASGREAVEEVFRNETGTPLTFDLIYGNFLSYIFGMAGRETRLPFSVDHAGGRGLFVPEIAPYIRLKTIPAIVEGSVVPYSFALIDLPRELPPTAIIEVEPVRRGQARPNGSLPCSETASVLWKPVTQKRLAVYAVGCEHESELDRVTFRFSVLDRPFR